MDAEQLHELKEDVAALLEWRLRVDERLHFLEERLPDPADKAHVRALRRMDQIKGYRDGSR